MLDWMATRWMPSLDRGCSTAFLAKRDGFFVSATVKSSNKSALWGHFPHAEPFVLTMVLNIGHYPLQTLPSHVEEQLDW